MSGRREKIEAMLRDEPNDAELRYMLAMEYASVGDDAGAVDRFRELIAVAPDYPPGYHMGARALSRLGRAPEAKAMLESGIPIAQRVGNFHAAGEMQELLSQL